MIVFYRSSFTYGAQIWCVEHYRSLFTGHALGSGLGRRVPAQLLAPSGTAHAALPRPASSACAGPVKRKSTKKERTPTACPHDGPRLDPGQVDTRVAEKPAQGLEPAIPADARAQNATDNLFAARRLPRPAPARRSGCSSSAWSSTPATSTAAPYSVAASSGAIPAVSRAAFRHQHPLRCRPCRSRGPPRSRDAPAASAGTATAPPGATGPGEFRPASPPARRSRCGRIRSSVSPTICTSWPSRKS